MYRIKVTKLTLDCVGELIRLIERDNTVYALNIYTNYKRTIGKITAIYRTSVTIKIEETKQLFYHLKVPCYSKQKTGPFTAD